MCKQSIGWANFVLAVQIWLRIGKIILKVNVHCFGPFRSGVFTIRGAVARVRAVNRCAVLHIGPVVAFLSHLRAL